MVVPLAVSTARCSSTFELKTIEASPSFTKCSLAALSSNQSPAGTPEPQTTEAANAEELPAPDLIDFTMFSAIIFARSCWFLDGNWKGDICSVIHFSVRSYTFERRTGRIVEAISRPMAFATAM